MHQEKKNKQKWLATIEFCYWLAGGDRNLFASLMLITRNLHKKSSEVSIKRRSPPASLSFKGQATKHYLKFVFLLANLNPDWLKGMQPKAWNDLCKNVSILNKSF